MDCEIKDHMLKAKVLGCFTGLYIPMLCQLRTMPYLDLGTINRMLREVHVNDILPKKNRQGGRHRLAQKAVMATSAGQQMKGKRNLSDEAYHSDKQMGHVAKKYPTASAPLL